MLVAAPRCSHTPNTLEIGIIKEAYFCNWVNSCKTKMAKRNLELSPLSSFQCSHAFNEQSKKENQFLFFLLEKNESLHTFVKVIWAVQKYCLIEPFSPLHLGCQEFLEPSILPNYHMANLPNIFQPLWP